MAPWLRFLEAWMVQQLLRTPAFHRAVEKVARNVHRIRHGTPPEEMGGTKTDDPQQLGFVKHFVEEVKKQLTGVETKQTGGVNLDRRALDSHHPSMNVKDAGASSSDKPAHPTDADSVWNTARKTASQPPKQGFLHEYMGALKEQIQSNKSNR